MIYYSIIFCFFIIIAAMFQLALASGAPWGKFAMGGKFPGKFPLKMRIAALLQMIILLFFGLVILIRSKTITSDLYPISKYATWFIVSFFVIGSVLNTLTQSKWEKILWAPVNIILLISSLMIALS